VAGHFIKESEICNAIKQVQLSQGTAPRGQNVCPMMLNNSVKFLKFVKVYSLQVNESTDVCDVSRMVFSDDNIKEALLETIPLHGKTNFKTFMLTFWKGMFPFINSCQPLPRALQP
jgi:hypothetical protein